MYSNFIRANSEIISHFRKCSDFGGGRCLQSILADTIGWFIRGYFANDVASYGRLKIEIEELVRKSGVSQEQIQQLIRDENIGWVFLHEEIANILPPLLARAFGSEIRLFHHTPKCGGTSIVRALSKARDNLQIFPTNDFETLTGTYGHLPIPKIVELIRNVRNGFFIYSGHYNLCDLLIEFELSEDVRGASIFCAPDKIVSSGIRFFWTKILQGDLANSNFDVELVRTVLSGLKGGLDKSTVTQAIRMLLNSDEFSNFLRDPLVRWYVGKQVQGVREFSEFIDRFKGVAFFSNPSDAVVEYLTGESIPVLLENVSTVSHGDLLNVLGLEGFRELIRDFVGNSDEVYRCLCAKASVI